MMLDKSLTPQSDKNHSSNPDICPRRITIPTNVGSHAMGYKDYSSNPYIRPTRINVLDHFPPGECLSTSTLTIHLADNHFQYYQ
jgi:hypothetical protein